MPVRPALRLAFATLVSSAALVMPSVGHAQQTFTIQSLDLYAGPAPDYPIVAHLYAGVQLRVIGCLPDYAWCDVLLPDGLRGWAYGPGLSYDWMGNALPVPQYGASIGIPIVGFVIGDYWGRNYRNQPWYDDWHWRHQAPPPVRIVPQPVPYPPHREWQSPYPPRWQGDYRRPDRDERGPDWRNGNRPQPPVAAPPSPQGDGGRFTPPRQERNDGPRFTPVPAAPSGGNPAPIAPPRQDNPRPDNRFSPPPQQNAPVDRPHGNDGPRNRFGGQMEGR